MMKNLLKYYCFFKRTKLESAIRELVWNINQLHTLSGKQRKQIMFEADNENVVDMLYRLSDEVKVVFTELDDARIKHSNVEKDIIRLEKEVQSAKMKAENLEKQLEEIKTDQKYQSDVEYKQRIEDTGKVVECKHDDRLKLIQSLIKFRDQLLLFKDNAEDEGAAKLLTNLYRESGRILSINGIEVLNSGGVFSPDHHIAVETIVTEQQELINTIESTFRDGYIVEGRLLRPQEVVVYVEKR